MQSLALEKTHTLWGIGWMMKPMSEVSSRFRWETPEGWLESELLHEACEEKEKLYPGQWLTSTHPVTWRMINKTYQHKNLKNNLNKEENHPHVISPIVECVSRSPTSEPHGLCLPV